MKKSKIILSTTVTLLLLIPAIIVLCNNVVPLKADVSPEVEFADYMDDGLWALLVYRDSMIADGKEDTEEFKSIQDKVDWEFKRIIQNKDEIDRLRVEAAKLNAAKADGTFVEPLWPDFPDPTYTPNPIMIKYGDECYAESMFPGIYHDMNFDSYGSASFECVYTGSYKETGHAFLTIINSDPVNYYDQMRFDYIYDDVNQILITDVLDEEKIMLFTFDGVNKGYVNLETFEVVFSEYKS